MNDDMNTSHQVEDDRDIRALMRESDYTGRMRDEFRRNLLRELNHNFAYHRLKTRLLVTAVVLLSGSAVIMQVTNVGSGDFNLVPDGSTPAGDIVLEAPLSGNRINAPIGDGNAAEAKANAESILERMDAGMTHTVQVEAWTIRGTTVFYETMDVLRDGKPDQIVNTPTDDGRFMRDYLLCLKSGGADYLVRIDRGELAPAGIDTVFYDGLTLPMARWTWTSPELGTIVYRRWDNPAGS